MQIKVREDEIEPLFSVGQRVRCSGVLGTIVPNTKLPNDICIQWDNGQFSSYDQWWVMENMDIVEPGE